MSGMSAAGWSLASACVFLAVWSTMMAAMMLPAAAPMIVVFASAQAGREGLTAVPTWIFVAGYLLVWVATGAAVYVLVQVGTETANLLSLTDRVNLAPLLLGFTLIAAGLYQFTPIKRVCLTIAARPLPSWHNTGVRDGSEHFRWACDTGLLSRMLLGPVCGARRRRNYEPGLDASADAGRFCRKGTSPRATHFNHDRCRICRPGARGLHWRHADAMAAVKRSTAPACRLWVRSRRRDADRDHPLSATSGQRSQCS
jgi:hypothetical protein